MKWEPKRLHPPLVALLIVGIGVFTTWLAASVAISDLRPDVLAAGLTSSLKADYGPTEAEELSLSPLDDAIVDSVAQDERDQAGEQSGAEVVYAPIFLVDEGNQEPVRLPSGEVQPAPTPGPTQPGEPTPTPKPAQPDKPTSTPRPTKTEKPTSTPRPTKTEKPTSTPRPTKTEKPTSTPRPAKTEKPSPTPKLATET